MIRWSALPWRHRDRDFIQKKDIMQTKTKVKIQDENRKNAQVWYHQHQSKQISTVSDMVYFQHNFTLFEKILLTTPLTINDKYCPTYFMNSIEFD